MTSSALLNSTKQMDVSIAFSNQVNVTTDLHSEQHGRLAWEIPDIAEGSCVALSSAAIPCRKAVSLSGVAPTTTMQNRCKLAYKIWYVGQSDLNNLQNRLTDQHGKCNTDPPSSRCWSCAAQYPALAFPGLPLYWAWHEFQEIYFCFFWETHGVVFLGLHSHPNKHRISLN